MCVGTQIRTGNSHNRTIGLTNMLDTERVILREFLVRVIFPATGEMDR